MNITRLAFKYNQFTWMILFLFVTSGVISFFYLGRNENAGFTVRLAQVITYMPGASPERIEELVTDKIETKIQEMPEIEYVNSESRSGISIINVKILDSYKEMDAIWTKLRRKVDSAIPNLPPSASKPLVNDEFGDVYAMIIGLVWDGYSYADVERVAEDLRNELLQIPNVSKVEIVGEIEERIYIEYQTSKLSELKIPPSHLVNTLQERNIINSGGVITSDTKRIPVEPSGNFNTVEHLKRTLVSIPGTSRVIKLEDIANVYRDYQNPGKSLLRVNGRDSIALAISMREKGDIVDLGKQVNALLQEKKRDIPLGIEYENILFMPDIVGVKIDNFMKSLYQAIGIVCLGIFLFLGLRTGLIVASLIPFSIITTFLAMSFLDIGLDQVSLPSLMVALGMLVDNGIVMSESIQVQMERGRSPFRAAIESANELRLSLLISSLTTSVSFLPIYLANSSTGEYTVSIFKVVSITLLISWTISSTIIPMICVSFLKVQKKQKEHLESHPIYVHYRNFLIFALKRKFYSLGVLIGIFALSIIAFQFVPKIFFPPSENPLLTAEIELPGGVSLKRTENTVKQIEQFIQSDLMVNDERKEGVTGWGFFIGDGGCALPLAVPPRTTQPQLCHCTHKRDKHRRGSQSDQSTRELYF